MGIIEYLPQKETPQIHFLVNRAPAAFLHIDQEQYLKRKQALPTESIPLSILPQTQVVAVACL
jgi:hypothetical protein